MGTSLRLQPKLNVIIADGYAQIMSTSLLTNDIINDLGWDMLFTTLSCHIELKTQTNALCLTGAVNIPSKASKVIKGQDP